jgi:hypothetical protein
MFEEKSGVNPAESDFKNSGFSQNSVVAQFQKMAVSPLVALLRKPGRVESSLSTTRSGEIRIKYGKSDYELVILRLLKGTCKIENKELGIVDEIDSQILIQLAAFGQSNWVTFPVKAGRKQLSISIERESLVNFLKAAGLIK